MKRWLLQVGLWLGSPSLVVWLAKRLNVTPAEREALASAEAARRRIASLYNMRCPLCGTEIQQAWTVTPDGRLGARRKSLCPTCDFRLDCCRHCQHFLLGGSGSHVVGGGGMPTLRISDDDYSSGRCGVYRTYTSVYELYDERTADRLATVGAESVRVPKAIQDSYVPLPECTAFSLAPKRLRYSGARLDRTWRTWLRWLGMDKS